MSDTPMADAAAHTCMDTTSEWYGEWVPLQVARQLEHKLAEATGENTRLRAALASSKDPCAYCQLPKGQMAKCRSGFPGCARADDLMGCPELGAALEVERLERELTEAKIGAARYEYVRKLTIHQYGALIRDCITWDLNFDTEVDRMRNQT